MIGIYFTEFADRDYLVKKIQAYLKARGSNYAELMPHLNYLASMVEERNIDLPLTDSKEALLRLSSPQVTDIRDKMATMLKHIDRQYPIIAGEKVVENNFAFLREDYASYRKGTPLLIRKTNMATMVHVFDHLEVSDGEIIFRPSPDNLREARLSNPRVKIGPADIIINLFSSMAKAIGGKLGAMIFDSIFPATKDDMEKMFKDLQDNIKVIFRNELDSQTITDLNSRISGLVSYMQETYLPQKKKGRDKPFLESLLIDQNQKMYTEVMALLTAERYRSKGIAYLVLGSNVHLALIQEMANIDPSCDDPGKSGYMQTYYMRLSDYITALENAINEVYSTRLTYVGEPQESVFHGAANDHWWFVDSWYNYQSEDYYNTHDCCDYKIDAKDKAVHARNEYIKNTFLPAAVVDMKPYTDTKSAWAEIERAEK